MRIEVTINQLVLNGPADFSDPELRSAIGDALATELQSAGPRFRQNRAVLAQTVDDVVNGIESATRVRLRG